MAEVSRARRPTLHPEYFDPRQYCGKAREYMVDLYSHKIKDVLHSDNKLANLD